MTMLVRSWMLHFCPILASLCVVSGFLLVKLPCCLLTTWKCVPLVDLLNCQLWAGWNALPFTYIQYFTFGMQLPSALHSSFSFHSNKRKRKSLYVRSQWSSRVSVFLSMYLPSISYTVRSEGWKLICFGIPCICYIYRFKWKSHIYSYWSRKVQGESTCISPWPYPDSSQKEGGDSWRS